MYYDKEKGLYREQITINGKRRVFSGKTRKAVKMKILNAQEKTEHSPKLKEVAAGWQEDKLEKMPEGSIRTYTAPLKRILEVFGEKEITSITPHNVQMWLSGLDYAYKTVRNHKTVLSQIFDYAILEIGIDMINPCDRIRINDKLPRGTREPLTDEERSEIEKTAPGELLLPVLILYTGMRAGEAMALQWHDVDFDHNEIHIDKALHHHGNQPYLGDLKTEKSFRTVPLLPQLRERLEVLDMQPDDFIVSGEKPLTKSALDKRWKKWCAAHHVNIDRHQIRHEYATILFEAGVEVKTAQVLLGHSNFSTTMDIYTHVKDRQLAAAEEKLNAYLTNTTF